MKTQNSWFVVDKKLANFLIYVLLKQMLKFACLSGGGTVSTVMEEGLAMSIILNLGFL